MCMYYIAHVMYLRILHMVDHIFKNRLSIEKLFAKICPIIMLNFMLAEKTLKRDIIFTFTLLLL